MLKKTLVVLMFPFFSYANELSVEQAKNMHDELNTDMRIMQEKMHAGMMSNDPDVAFAAGMLLDWLPESPDNQYHLNK
ncbi:MULTISPECIES: hypothetical protein [Escherichia]|uniref:hypothetical protein n=1 Tax=Escherichia TaxID=561 RepID=UPI000AD6C5C7|nr:MULTISPECIES: hypothetical protein [Escherichia]WDB33715.1 hypothetical protein PS032_22110 [Escherichia albertii]